MDDLLREFIVETAEHLAEAEVQLVQFERNPDNSQLIASIFRFVHTIKGTSGFLGLSELQSVGHAAETLLGRMRDGEPPRTEAVTLILQSIDRIRRMIGRLEQTGAEEPGCAGDIVDRISSYLSQQATSGSPTAVPASEVPSPGRLVDQLSNQGDADAATATKEQAAQSLPTKSNPSAAGGETIRVSVQTLEGIMQLVSELVLSRNQLLELTRGFEHDMLKIALQRISGLTSDLQGSVMRARLQPVGKLFANLPRLVRELSSELGKPINLVLEGGETELDRQLIEVIRDPVTHLIRNCADHGIEAPQMRLAVGKPEQAQITVRAFQDAGQFVIEISDDGKGIDVDRVKAKAIASGLASAADVAQMSDEQACQLIFAPGFSTAEKVTNVSGRGVGMDVVRTNIESVRGTATLHSTRDKGTRFILRLPLTLAIAPALILDVAGSRFAIPQHSVVEVVEAKRDSAGILKRVHGALVVDLRGDVLPATDLAELLEISRQSTAEQPQVIVVIRTSGSTIGLVVDAVLEVQEIVVKPLNRSLSGLEVYSGQTILGDGSVLLILEAAGIARRLLAGAVQKSRPVEDNAATRDNDRRFVLFRAGDGVEKILPVSLVSRVVQITAADLFRGEAGTVMRFEGRLIPVIEAASGTIGRRVVMSTIVVSVSGTTFGLVVDEVVDILSATVEIDVASNQPGSHGFTRIHDRIVVMLDAVALSSSVIAMRVPGQSMSPRSLLLVAESVATHDLIVPFLVAEGMSVETARNAEEVRNFSASGKRFDAIIVDDAPSLADQLSPMSHLGDGEGIPIIRLVDAHDDKVGEAATCTRLVASKLDRGSLRSVIATLRTAA
jgi:two-component system chemotaxis sensor kinase CheA